MEGAGVSGEVAGGGAVTWGLGDCATTHSAHLRAVPAFPLHLLPLLGILPDPLRSREVPLGNRQASVSAPSPRGFRRTVHSPTILGSSLPSQGKKGSEQGRRERPEPGRIYEWRAACAPAQRPLAAVGSIAAPGTPGDLARGLEKPVWREDPFLSPRMVHTPHSPSRVCALPRGYKH